MRSYKIYNHVSNDYQCPFCVVVAGEDRAPSLTVQSDVIYRDDQVMAFICVDWWANNPGHVLIIPNKHIENLYDLPADLSAAVHQLEREVAIALKKVYDCEGTSSRQHNEPAGYQSVFHYHLHVFPRWRNDHLYGSDFRRTTPQERLPYAEKLRTYFESLKRE